VFLSGCGVVCHRPALQCLLKVRSTRKSAKCYANTALQNLRSNCKIFAVGVYSLIIDFGGENSDNLCHFDTSAQSLPIEILSSISFLVLRILSTARQVCDR
jgi:hypothetical protein